MSLKVLYENISKKAFWTCLIISIGLIITSFFLPPTGVVEPSVCGAVGELFGFGALATVIDGLHRGADVSVTKGDVNINVTNPDKKDEECE